MAVGRRRLPPQAKAYILLVAAGGLAALWLMPRHPFVPLRVLVPYYAFSVAAFFAGIKFKESYYDFTIFAFVVAAVRGEPWYAVAMVLLHYLVWPGRSLPFIPWHFKVFNLAMFCIGINLSASVYHLTGMPWAAALSYYFLNHALVAIGQTISSREPLIALFKDRVSSHLLVPLAVVGVAEAARLGTGNALVVALALAYLTSEAFEAFARSQPVSLPTAAGVRLAELPVDGLRIGKLGLIVVDESLRPVERDEVIAHERAHAGSGEAVANLAEYLARARHFVVLAVLPLLLSSPRRAGTRQ